MRRGSRCVLWESFPWLAARIEAFLPCSTHPALPHFPLFLETVMSCAWYPTDRPDDWRGPAALLHTILPSLPPAAGLCSLTIPHDQDSATALASTVSCFSPLSATVVMLCPSLLCCIS